MKFRVLIVVAVLALIGSFVVRSSNSRHANALVSQILANDKSQSGDNVHDIDQLMAYAKNHQGVHEQFTMQTSYDNAVTEAKAAAAVSSQNSEIYAAAQTACSGKTDSITQAKCNQAYLQSHLVAEPTTAQVTAPNLSNYQYSVTSPFWTIDLAGVLQLAGLVLGIGGVVGVLRRKS